MQCRGLMQRRNHCNSAAPGAHGCYSNGNWSHHKWVSNKSIGHRLGESGTENLRVGLGSEEILHTPKMDYLTSTIQDYQPILVGAGCLALGYMYGRHCRAVMENQSDAPATSDAACCAQITESFNYILDHAAVDSKTMAVKRPSESDLVRTQNFG